MIKHIVGAVFFLVTIALVSIIITPVFASGDVPIYGGIPVYGGGVMVPGQVLVDKTVLNPASNIYVDNLGPTDPKFHPEQIVPFRVVIKNSGQETLDTVSVVDKLPQFVEYISSPGSYDQKNRTINFTATNIAGGTSQIFEVKVRVVHATALPEGKNVVCPVNSVDAISKTLADHDDSQFCIEKEFIMPTTPKAGPEHWIMSIVGLSSLLSSGLYLRKQKVQG